MWDQRAKTAARIAPKKATAPAWRLVLAVAADVPEDEPPPDPGVDEGLGLVDEPEGLMVDDDTTGGVEMAETEVNDTGLGVGRTVEEGVIPEQNCCWRPPAA